MSEIEGAISEVIGTNYGEVQCHRETMALAAQALREKAERDKGCEYCIDLSKHKGFGYAEFFEQTAADNIYEISIEVRYCPNCGRRLEGQQSVPE